MIWVLHNLPWIAAVWCMAALLVVVAWARRPQPVVFKPRFPPTHSHAHWPAPPKPCARAWEFKTSPRDPAHAEEDRIREGWIRSMRQNMDLGMRIYELEMENRDLALHLRGAYALLHIRQVRGDLQQDEQAAENGMGI